MLRAINSIGASLASNSVSAIPVTIPSTPTNLRATASNSQVRIEYTPGYDGGSNITNYEYSLNNGSFVSTTANPIVIEGLLNGIIYSFVLRAVTVVGKSVVSDSVSFKPVTLPSAPTNLRPTPTDRQVSILYTPGYDGGSDITNYEYSINNGSFVSTTANPIVITNLFNGTTYSFVLRAVTDVGRSVVSDSVPFKPVTLPSAPTDLKATPTDKQAIISFTDGINGGSDIKNYAYSLNDGPFVYITVANPFVIGGLVNGTLYSIKLKAITIIGESVASSAVPVTPYTVPSTPLIISNSISDKQINITTDQESNGGSAVEFNYEYSTDGINFRLFNPAITLVNNRYGTLTITKLSVDGTTSLTNGTTYLIQIRAVNIAGPSAASTLSATPATFPDPPTGLLPTVGNKVVRIDFTPGLTGGSELTNYEYSTDGTTFIDFTPVDKTSPVIISKQSITDTPALVNGITYFIALKAKNSIGSSIASSTLPAKPHSIPDVPIILGITSINGYLSINFTLNSDGGSALTKYQYSLNNGTFYDVSVPTNNYIIITGLTLGISYYAQLKAVNSVGTSAASAASASLLLYRVPLAPIITSIDPGNNKAIIHFTADNGGKPIQNFTIMTLKDGSFSLPAYLLSPAVTQSPITINGLDNGATYDFQIRTNTDAGLSEPSNSVSSIPQRTGSITVPEAPTITSVDFGERKNPSRMTISFRTGYNGGRPITYILLKLSYGLTIPSHGSGNRVGQDMGNGQTVWPTTSPLVFPSFNTSSSPWTFSIAIENDIGVGAWSEWYTMN